MATADDGVIGYSGQYATNGNNTGYLALATYGRK
jgi:hypothetical protein